MKTLMAGILAILIGFRVASTADADLVFTPEPGARVDVGAIPEAGLDASGATWLYYTIPVPMGGERVAVSADGVTFPAGSTFTTFANDPRNTRLPNGTYRRFAQKNLPSNFDISSQSSTDGINFTADAGIRYSPASGDNGTIGIVEVFSQAGGDVVMLYLGDLSGRNNTRRARSKDGGNTFSFEAGNILGDDNAGGGGNSYVDITTIVLPDGRRRLFAMKGGKGIYSFISSDDGQTFVQEPGARLMNTDFTGLNVIGMFDPSIVRLTDGRYRMYVAANIDLGGGSIAHSILSAITGAGSSGSGALSITSGPTAAPNPTQPGVPVQFSAAASGSATLSYAWDFGDGSIASGSSVSHAYASAGTFNAAVTVSDGSTSVSGTVAVTVTAAQTLNIASLKLTAVFSKAGSDSFRLSASLALPKGQSLGETSAILNIGGAMTTFQLDARGHASNAQATFVLRPGAPARVTANGRGGNFNSLWLADGLLNSNSRGTKITMPVTLSIGSNTYSGFRVLTYSAHAGRAGTAK